MNIIGSRVFLRNSIKNIPKSGFLLAFFGTSFGLLHKNQKKGKRSLGEGQKKTIFYSTNDDKKTLELQDVPACLHTAKPSEAAGVYLRLF